MRQRTISAFFFAVIMLSGIFGGHYSFLILFGMIAIGSLWEFSGLVFADDPNHLLYRRVVTVGMGIVPFLVKAINYPVQTGETLAYLLMVLVPLGLFFIVMLIELFLGSVKPFEKFGLYLVGLVYIGFPLMLVSWIAHIDGVYAPMRILGILLLTWANDSMAYMIGSRIGKTPFAPRISPKKTWEGTLGGVVFTFVFAWVIGSFNHDFTMKQWLILGGVVATVGTAGDLIESLLKRSLGVKDSGNILPGHGGFLDRFDSFLFLIPFAAFCLLIFGQ